MFQSVDGEAEEMTLLKGFLTETEVQGGGMAWFFSRSNWMDVLGGNGQLCPVLARYRYPP